MRYLLFYIILCTVSICVGNRLRCQFFDNKTKILKQYCDEFNDAPINCTRDNNFIESLSVNSVEHLKIGGCNAFIVLDAVERYSNIYSFDIASSHFQSLNWLDSSSFQLQQLQKFNASYNEIASIIMLLENTPEIREIDLSHNHLTTINSNTFGRMEKLAIIDLSHNHLQEIANDTFSNAYRLQTINLNNNHFSTIPIFYNVKQLKTIQMKWNRITSFNYCSYTKLNAVSIDFSFKYLTTFYQDKNCVGNLIEPLQMIWNNKYEGIRFTGDGNYEIHFNENSFQHLNTFVAGRNLYANVMNLLHHFGTLINQIDLTGNRIGQLHATTFERFNNLSVLILRETHLNEFDVNWIVNQQSCLQMLDISGNNLKFIKSVWLLDDFHTMRELNVAENRIANIAEFIQHLRSPIEQFQLSGNSVGKVDITTFQRITALSVLNLSETSLSMSNTNPFEHLTKLQILDISYNNLKNVNFSTISLTLSKLNQLYVRNCEIEHISELIFYLRSPIKVLDLSGNYMGMLNVRAFEQLIHLEYLNLSNIHMFHFDFYALRYQTHLQILDISDNKLQEIDLEPLHGQLMQLYLQENDLTKVEHLNGNHFLRLKLLQIDNNYLSCDFLKWLINHWNDLKFIGDPLHQKIDCDSHTQTVSEFFHHFYDSIKFW